MKDIHDQSSHPTEPTLIIDQLAHTPALYADESRSNGTTPASSVTHKTQPSNECLALEPLESITPVTPTPTSTHSTMRAWRSDMQLHADVVV